VFYAGRQNILARMLGGAESVLSDACAIANGTEGNFPLPPMKISPDMPLGATRQMASLSLSPSIFLSQWCVPR
jgi:hypothetical protein